MRIALLGAGFTRNWGGWLASELVGELCGRIEDDAEVLARLKETRNFEQVLSEVRQQANKAASSKHRFDNFQQAILSTFSDMNQMLAGKRFEFNLHEDRWVLRFLASFDAIFTLNQDLMLELHYSPSKDIESKRRFLGNVYPGVALPANWNDELPAGRLGVTLSESGSITSYSGYQPIYKLHGSVNWRTTEDSPIVVIGGSKDATIRQSKLLSSYLERFRDYLSAGGTRLMVIGYGFADEHINNLIVDASEKNGLMTYLVNPSGLSIFDPPSRALITEPNRILSALRLKGILTRPFCDAFISDALAFNSLKRFLDDH